LSDGQVGKSVPEELIAAVGAVIFASGEPVRPIEIAEAFGDVEAEQIEQAIRALERQYAGNRAGLRLERVAGGVRLATRPEVAERVRQFFRQRNRARLSPAALETLAIVAYRQPVTAPEIQAIRGKDPSAALKGLLDKKLVRILGKKKVVGSPLLYGTSKQFLIHFGLDGLEDLPSMEEFDAFVQAFEQPDPGREPDPQPHQA
jgi:segregation and condensation protein B